MIVMTGIDHTTAPVDIRACFSFTKENMRDFMTELRAALGLNGVVVIATCNRMEVWADFQDRQQRNDAPEEMLPEAVCRARGLDPARYADAFVCRREREAVDHLFYLTCGLKSAILAEDQIITQVKDALAFARECELTNGVLEVLFRMAVTGAKRVKTEVVFSHANATAMDEAVKMMHEQGIDLDGLPCLVIGNGEMGKLSAARLAGCGADVTVTVRQYRSGHVAIPAGCRRIDYADRYALIPHCRVIVSATTSPHFTLGREAFAQCLQDQTDADPEGDRILIDLSVPRDIDPGIGSLPGVRLYDIDAFRTASAEGNEESFRKAEEILREETEEFWFWMDGRAVIPRVQMIQGAAGRDLQLRVQKGFRRLDADPAEKMNLEEQVGKSASKVVGKLLFALRDALDPDEYNRCVTCLEELYHLRDADDALPRRTIEKEGKLQSR